MKTIKKVWPEFFEEILNGSKKYELRLADFECSKGDILVLKEYNPETKEYSGRELEKEVTYISKTKDVPFWPKEEIEKHGLQVIGFR